MRHLMWTKATHQIQCTPQWDPGKSLHAQVTKAMANAGYSNLIN